MKEYIRTTIFVIILLVVGYFLLPYVKINPKKSNPPADSASQDNSGTGIQTFSSDTLSASFKYNSDQDADGKVDTAVKESADKVYVYYTASTPENGQWVQKFTKDPKVSLADAVKKQFIPNIPDTKCFVKNMGDFYEQYGASAPPQPENVDRVLIAYPFPTDTNQPYTQNEGNCPETYRLSNGLSYFEMDKNHPDKYYFFSIGQYAIKADDAGNQTWQDTFAIK